MSDTKLATGSNFIWGAQYYYAGDSDIVNPTKCVTMSEFSESVPPTPFVAGSIEVLGTIPTTNNIGLTMRVGSSFVLGSSGSAPWIGSSGAGTVSQVRFPSRIPGATTLPITLIVNWTYAQGSWLVSTGGRMIFTLPDGTETMSIWNPTNNYSNPSEALTISVTYNGSYLPESIKISIYGNITVNSN